MGDDEEVNSSPWENPVLQQGLRDWAAGCRISDEDVQLAIERAATNAFYKLLNLGIYVPLLAVAAWFGFEAIKAHPETYLQHLSIELTSGILLFLASPFIVLICHKIGWAGRALMLSVAIACGVGAYWREQPARGFLIEACIGLALLVCLEIQFREWNKRLKEAFERKKLELDQKRANAVSDRDTDADEVFPVQGHGFGDVDQFEPKLESAAPDSNGANPGTHSKDKMPE